MPSADDQPGRDRAGRQQPPAAHRRREPPPAHRCPSRQRYGRLERRADSRHGEPGRIRRRGQHLPAQLHRQRRERHPGLRGPAPEPAQPPPRRGVRDTGPLRRRARPGPAAGHLLDHPPGGLRAIQPPRQHERRQQHMSHPARAAAQPRHEDPPAAARLPHPSPVPRPEHHPPGARWAARARELHLAAGRRIGIDRHRARPYDGHGDTAAPDPSSQSVAKRGEEGSSLSLHADSKILAAQQQPGGDIVKEHGRTPGTDAQEIRPSTPGAQITPWLVRETNRYWL